MLHYRGADITASDYHPLSEPFLDFNTDLNKLEPIPYINLPWADVNEGVGPFDLIVGSDVLYEPNHSELLAGLIGRIASRNAKVLISCQGRGYRNQFSRLLEEQGFELSEKRVPFNAGEKPPYRGRLLTYRRND